MLMMVLSYPFVFAVLYLVAEAIELAIKLYWIYLALIVVYAFVLYLKYLADKAVAEGKFDNIAKKKPRSYRNPYTGEIVKIREI